MPKSANTKSVGKLQTVTKQSSKLGRPTEKPNPLIIEEVLFWISSGNTLRSYCRQKGKPAFTTIYNWLNKDKEFTERFVRAREVGSDMIADSIMEIMSETPEMIGGDNPRIDPGWVALQKAKSDVALKLLSKWFPQRYGDRVGVEAKGDINLTISTGLPQG